MAWRAPILVAHGRGRRQRDALSFRVRQADAVARTADGPSEAVVALHVELKVKVLARLKRLEPTDRGCRVADCGERRTDVGSLVQRRLLRVEHDDRSSSQRARTRAVAA